jgi:GT2 family glycosyltransferase
MSIGIVIVNWNRWQLTEACIAALRLSLNAKYHSYVVDNASTDGSADHLAALGSDVTLIRHHVNAGWAGGNNVGVARALGDGHDFIMLLNNDAVPRPDTLAILSRVEANLTGTGGPRPVLGPVERRQSGCFGFVRATEDPQTGIPRWNPRDEVRAALQQELIPTSYVQGSALFTHRSVFERTGLFDERYFLYYDETDWCYRAAYAGHPLLMVRDATVQHESGATTGGLLSVLETYFMTRNRLLFAELHCTRQQRQALAQRHRSRRHVYFASGEALAEAFRQGERDYVERRFGDCPPHIRALAEAAAKETSPWK